MKLIDHVLITTGVFVVSGAVIWIMISAIAWLIESDAGFHAWILAFGCIGALVGSLNWYVNSG